ncbi:hypothetical protein BO78DRAFT_17893 [Aspergillus sclerotiicarbonarius CBS 121057]|uniref:Uncharacterized protein n=1 Tax=Aspergillus sclerotiicarbonarius (strain CBS 121057 / IBT 28362) TaxID=1448318 RepID=A0A319DU90_ASPSB|nr:hypothetical protein BO78DRAFT_17893 [Aspergillus sclerotiicarbonarius CBS 121057]
MHLLWFATFFYVLYLLTTRVMMMELMYTRYPRYTMCYDALRLDQFSSAGCLRCLSFLSWDMYSTGLVHGSAALIPLQGMPTSVSGCALYAS